MKQNKRSKPLAWMTPVISYRDPNLSQVVPIDCFTAEDEERGWVPTEHGTHLWVGAGAAGADPLPISYPQDGLHLMFVLDSAIAWNEEELAGEYARTKVRNVPLCRYQAAKDAIADLPGVNGIVLEIAQSINEPERIIHNWRLERRQGLGAVRTWTLRWYELPQTPEQMRRLSDIALRFPFAVWLPRKRYPHPSEIEKDPIPYRYKGPPFPRLGKVCPFKPHLYIDARIRESGATTCEVVGRQDAPGGGTSGGGTYYIVKILDRKGQELLTRVSQAAFYRWEQDAEADVAEGDAEE